MVDNTCRVTKKPKTNINLEFGIRLREEGEVPLFFEALNTLTHCRTVHIKFCLRSVLWSQLRPQTEFLFNPQDKTERLSALEKFMQIRTKTKVF